MSKSDLVSALVAVSAVKITKEQAAAVLDALEKYAHDQVRVGNEVELPGLVKFSRVKRAARTGRNLHTGASIEVPEHNAVKVRVLGKFKTAVKG